MISNPETLRADLRGFTLIELLVVALIAAICMLTIGTGFARLSQLEDLNREKARMLEAVCDRFAWTQPYVAIGSKAITFTNNTHKMGGVNITYPHIVFGVSCETNSFMYVTNTVLAVREDGVLQTVVGAATVTGNRSVTNAMDWMDPIFIRTAQPWMTNSSVRVLNPAGDRVALTYRYGIVVKERSSYSGHAVSVVHDVGLTIPIRLRNSMY